MELKLTETDDGCIVPVSHKLDRDGYFYRRVLGQPKKWEFYHRYIFRTRHGLERIPEGFEIDHMCGNRACCNVNHLQMLPREQHKSETARESYERKKVQALLFWRWTNCDSSALGPRFGVSPATATKWIAGWQGPLETNDAADSFAEG